MKGGVPIATKGLPSCGKRIHTLVGNRTEPPHNDWTTRISPQQQQTARLLESSSAGVEVHTFCGKPWGVETTKRRNRNQLATQEIPIEAADKPHLCRHVDA
jgi:hypothetical protein